MMSYWEARQEQKYLAGEMKVKEYYKRLEKTFEQSKKGIHSVINDFYVRYMNENNIVSYADAQRLLSKVEIGDLKDFIAKVNENMGKYNLELNNMSIKARITRYQALEKQIDALLQELYFIDYQYQGEDALKDVYSDAYYRTWFNIDQYHSFHQEFAQVNPHTIEELIKYPFNGADFSTRIWKQKDHMLQQLNESITTMLVQGKNPSTLSADFAKKFKTKKYEAYRLLQTESSFIMEQASQTAYQEDGVEKYQWLATLDLKTCEDCGPLDGETFDIGKGITGETLPPKHSWCRCTTVPYYEDVDTADDTRAARDTKTGKSTTVDADMNYTEWHKEYVESNPAAVTAEKKWKNRHGDRAQYERYKEVLGKDTPKNFDGFQNLKYNDSEDYRLVKVDYSRRKKLIDNPELKLPNAEKAIIAEDKFTKYLFAGKNEDGLIKGRLISNKLGYDINNYKEFREDILNRAKFNPSRIKGKNKQGVKYEQRIIFYNKHNIPVNLEVGWLNGSSGTHMTSIYINEVRNDES